MRFVFSALFVFACAFAGADQLEFDFGHPDSILKNAHYYNDNIRLSYDVPEEITKAWDERDFGFEIADGYYGYGPSAQYEVLGNSGEVIGYMLVQTLSYSEDPEYHVAYTVCDVQGRTVIELEYDVYSESENNQLPPELQWVDEDAY